MYTPDRWIKIELINSSGEKHQRILAGWYGGYTGGDSWKINSGIEREEKHENYIDFYGSSGSVYHCYKQHHGMSGLMAGVLHSYQDEYAKEGGSIKEVV